MREVENATEESAGKTAKREARRSANGVHGLPRERRRRELSFEVMSCVSGSGRGATGLCATGPILRVR
jgi:hypothetical protein